MPTINPTNPWSKIESSSLTLWTLGNEIHGEREEESIKYTEGMEEDVAVRPGMPLFAPGLKGKAFPQGRFFSSWERERGEVFFMVVGSEWVW
jgi:hypothetical protein